MYEQSKGGIGAETSEFDRKQHISALQLARVEKLLNDFENRLAAEVDHKYKEEHNFKNILIYISGKSIITYEYTGAVKPPVREFGNRDSGRLETGMSVS